MTPELGKRIGDEVYLHHTALAGYPDPQLRAWAQSTLAAIPSSGHPTPNVFKVNQRLGRASWLAYSSFDVDPFPAVAVSWSFHRVSSAAPPAPCPQRGHQPAHPSQKRATGPAGPAAPGRLRRAYLCRPG